MRTVALVLLLVSCSPKKAQDSQPPPSKTRLVMLGTGTPQANPDRHGPSLAIIADDQAYIVDCGPGVVRRAAATGIEALEPEGLTRLFVTHLHSDHTAGYADLILTPWVLGRDTPLEVHGPPGIDGMTTHILEAYSEDIRVRLEGNQPANEPGIKVNTHVISPGPVYSDPSIKVTAFEVQHGDWKNSFGFRFETSDRSIVVSGDTVPTQSTIDACSSCDVLVHEVYAKKGFDTREPDWQAYHKVSHTSGIDLGKLAAKANPSLLVLTHQLLWGATEQDLLDEVKRNFKGRVVYADDLDVF